jgi:hypothetical protein
MHSKVGDTLTLILVTIGFLVTSIPRYGWEVTIITLSIMFVAGGLLNQAYHPIPKSPFQATPKKLAALIRKGLKTGAVEDNRIWGVQHCGDEIHANVVGFALIGKVGIERALRLTEEFLAEADSKCANCALLQELGINLTQADNLARIDFFKADEIATHLKSGFLNIGSTCLSA